MIRTGEYTISTNFIYQGKVHALIQALYIPCFRGSHVHENQFANFMCMQGTGKGSIWTK